MERNYSCLICHTLFLQHFVFNVDPKINAETTTATTVKTEAQGD